MIFSQGIGFGNAAILSSSPPGPVLPSAIGNIYFKTLGDNIGDWIVPGSFTGTVNMVVDGTDFVMSGTGGTGGTGASNLFKDFILLNTTAHKITCLSKWKSRARFTTGTVNQTNSYGFSMGVISTNSFEFRDSLCRLAQDSGGVLGGAYFYYGDTSATGINNQTAPGALQGYSLQDATTYEVEFEKDYLTFTTRLYAGDGTSLLNTNTTTNSPPGGTVTKVHHNTGRFAIAQHGGTNRIHWIKISSDALKNVPIAGIGDSHFYGGKASTLAASMFHSAFAGQDYTLCAGWADRAVDMETRIAEIIAINPTKLLIECGSNDIKAGTWGSTGQPALDSMTTQCQAAGIDVRQMSAPARNDVDVTAVQTYMASTGLPLFNAFGATKQPTNTSLLGAYNSGDGVHLDDDGHPVCATGIQNVMT